MDHPLDLTSVAQDYLKVVWSAQEWSDEPVTTKLLADRLGVGASTVSETVRRLSSQGLLVHARYGAIELTDLGRSHAVAMVRRHRILETYLVSELGYSWDEVHDEAEVLEHVVSDRFVERIAEHLGHPTVDPHGDPIPTSDGRILTRETRLLARLEPGSGGVIVRVNDSDPALLRYLASQQISIGMRVELVERQPFGGPLVVRLDSENGQDERSIGVGVAEALWIAADH